MKKLNLLIVILLLSFMQQTIGQASLYVTDPQNTWYNKQGRIEQATLSIKPAGAYFEMGLYLTLSSNGTNFTGDRQLESFMYFSLPEGSIVLDSWLWVYGDIVQGKIIDKWTASNIYEGIVDRRRDPSILTKNGEDSYELRVYPMKPGQQRKVKITYLVPCTWSGGRASAPLPTDILRASNNIPKLHTLLWNDDSWSDPQIPEIQEEVFEEFFDEEFGYYSRYDIESTDIEGGLSFSLQAPLTNGVYFTAGEDISDNGVYQVAVDFSQFLEPGLSKKIAVLVDYEATNTNLTREQVFSTLEQNLLEKYTEKDSFNIFYSRYEIEGYSDKWMAVNLDNVQAALQPLKDGFQTLYSNLPGLISKGNSFIEQTGGGSIVLYSNAENFANSEKANALIKDIRKMNSVPISIADFQNKNITYERIGGYWYKGQEYLFINLSRMTGGVYERLENSVNLSALCSKVLASLSGSITAFEFYSIATDGFCFGRYNANNDEVYHIGDYFIQTGKFIGQAPFTLNLTGIYNNEPFNELITVNQDQIIQGDSLLRKSWYGQHIQELENEEENNELINQILDESITHRTLSKYTAFLCLEPSDTVAVCLTCDDESRLTWIDEKIFSESDSLQLYPNPCTDFVNLSFNSGISWDKRDTRVEVYSIMGELVYSFDPDFIPGQEVKIKWDLSNENGSRVANGYYMIIVSHKEESFSKRLIVK